MTKEQWLNQIVLFDKWGRPPSLADVPLTYGARKKAFKLMKYSDEKINKLYKEQILNKGVKIMGAHCQQDFAIGRFKTAVEAYNKLVKEAQRRHGDDGYNGTISTSDGIKMVTEHPRYGTNKFWKFVDNTMDGTKFSRWNCIEFKGATLKRAKEESGYKGKKNIKAFFFWGLAAS